MKMILKKSCVSKIVLIMKLFLQTFCKKNLIFFIIILVLYSQLSRLIVFYYHKALNTCLSTILYGNNAFRMDTDWN